MSVHVMVTDPLPGRREHEPITFTVAGDLPEPLRWARTEQGERVLVQRLAAGSTGGRTSFVAVVSLERELRLTLGRLRGAAMWQAAVAARASEDFAECARGFEDMAAETGIEGQPEATLRFEAAACHEAGGAFAAAHYESKLTVARFYFERMMPRTASLYQAITAGGESVLGMALDAF